MKWSREHNTRKTLLDVMDGYLTTFEGCSQCQDLLQRPCLHLAEVRVWVGKYVLLGQTPCIALARADKTDR